MKTDITFEAQTLSHYYTVPQLQVVVKSGGGDRDSSIDFEDAYPAVFELQSSSMQAGELLTDSPKRTEWKAPVALNPKEKPKIDFPVDACGPILGAAIKAASAICMAPVSMVANSILAASAFAVQRKNLAPAIGPGIPEEPCSLFVLTIAESGDRKSSVDKLACAPINHWEKSCFTGDGFPIEIVDQTSPGLSGPIEYSRQGTRFGDVTYEFMAARLISDINSSIGLFSDEGGSFLGGYSMTSSTRQAAVSGLVKLWDNGVVERYRITNPDGNGKVFGRRLSAHLMSQPIAIQETLSDPYMLEQGVLARFLVSAPQSLAGSRFLNFDDLLSPRDVSPELEAYHQRMRELLESPLRVSASGEILAEALPISDGAIRVFVDNCNALETEVGQLTDRQKLLKPYLSRLAQHARRLATVLAVMNRNDGIEAEMMAKAFEIVMHSKATWTQLLLGSKSQNDLSDAFELLKFLLRQASPVNFRVIQNRGPNALRTDSKRRMELLEILAQYHWLKIDQEAKSISMNPNAMKYV